MLHDRSASILEASIREFIRTGEPISSGLLFDRYRFGIRPAMIRNELQGLTEQGFLEQPYHSSGRVPSDKGYHFFVERILEQDGSPKLPDRAFEEYFHKARWHDLLEYFSDRMGILGVVDDLESDAVYKEGLDELLEKLDWDYPDEIKEVVRDFENLEERLAHAHSFLENMQDVGVFIGRQSPVTRSRQLSVVAGEYRGGGRNVVILAIGPKRMDYQKVINYFRGFSE